MCVRSRVAGQLMHIRHSSTRPTFAFLCWTRPTKCSSRTALRSQACASRSETWPLVSTARATHARNRYLQRDVQVLLFSATFGEAVEKFAQTFAGVRCRTQLRWLPLTYPWRR
jgi:hypothetical protein